MTNNSKTTINNLRINNVNERKLIAYVYDECNLFTVDSYKEECLNN